MNTEFPKQLPEKIESKKEFELDYEPFNPEIELEKLKKCDKETRADRLEEYKKELIKQKEGIVEIQENLEKQIRNNPELSQQELMKTVFAKAPGYRLSENQLDLFKKVLNKYTQRHQAVREARKKYPDDKELFEVCFGRKPKGTVEVTEGPVALSFRCHGIRDYIWIREGRPYHKTITKTDLKKADLTGGTTTTKCLIPSLKNTIIAEKATRLKSPYLLQEVFKHEEQHLIHKLYTETRFSNLIKKLLTDKKIRDQIVTEFRDKKSSESLIDCLKFQRKNIEEFAKNEIIAYCKMGTATAAITKKLLRPREENGIYDYFNVLKEAFIKTLKQKLTPEIFDKNKRAIEKILKQVFVDEYQQEITKATNAIKELEKMGKSREEIIYLLITEPLSRWSKLVERIKNHASSS